MKDCPICGSSKCVDMDGYCNALGCNVMKDKDLTMSRAEAEELYAFTLNQYLSPNTFPALRRLLDRVSQYLKEKAA